jgi:hypothetical protein
MGIPAVVSIDALVGLTTLYRQECLYLPVALQFAPKTTGVSQVTTAGLSSL